MRKVLEVFKWLSAFVFKGSSTMFSTKRLQEAYWFGMEDFLGSSVHIHCPVRSGDWTMLILVKRARKALAQWNILEARWVASQSILMWGLNTQRNQMCRTQLLYRRWKVVDSNTKWQFTMEKLAWYQPSKCVSATVVTGLSWKKWFN